MQTDELLKKAHEILSSYPFEKVHAYMLLTEWNWYNHDKGISGIPTLDDIKKTAEQMLINAVWHDNEAVNVGTGGFMAYKLPHGLVLSFEPFSKHSY